MTLELGNYKFVARLYYTKRFYFYQWELSVLGSPKLDKAVEKFFFSNYRPIITKNKYEKSTKKFRRKEEDIYNSKYFINSR